MKDYNRRHTAFLSQFSLSASSFSFSLSFFPALAPCFSRFNAPYSARKTVLQHIPHAFMCPLLTGRF